VGVTATEATGTELTVIEDGADFPSLAAVMIALPGTSAVTSPVLLTVATATLLLVNSTGRPVSTFPSASSVSAPSWTVCPTSRFWFGGVSLTLATGVGLTVTSAMAFFPTALAAMCTTPVATPVTTPELDTVAIEGSALAQTTLIPVSVFPAASSTSAFNVTFAPTATVAVDGVMTTEATSPPPLGSRESPLHEMAATMTAASHRTLDCDNRI
jgi:hypothetical protein